MRVGQQIPNLQMSFNASPLLQSLAVRLQQHTGVLIRPLHTRRNVHLTRYRRTEAITLFRRHVFILRERDWERVDNPANWQYIDRRWEVYNGFLRIIQGDKSLFIPFQGLCGIQLKFGLPRSMGLINSYRLSLDHFTIQGMIQRDHHLLF